MKEKNHKSKHHSREESRHSEHNSNKYKNVLKEKHYREISNSNKEDDRPHKNKSSQRDHKKHSPPDRSNERRENNKVVRDKTGCEESYEELSRKKRKIVRELQALDLEEAAAKKVKLQKEKKESRSEKIKEKPQPVKIKEEPDSDDTDRRPPRARNTNRSSANQRDQQKPPSSTEDNETSWGRVKEEAERLEKREKDKEKPNFEVSGKLAEDTNVYNGVVIKYNEPSEARKPKRRWRLYPFKGDSDLPFIPIHRQSAYLFGRTRSIADIPIDHPSCSKQHAVLQYRLVPYKREDGTTGRRVRPYIIDLESSNGTFVNNKPIKPRCYVELIEKDVIKFGYSSREYVILHEDSKHEEDDDVLDSN